MKKSLPPLPQRPPTPLELEHKAWRDRMQAVTKHMQANPHRSERTHGPDGHFRHGVFISGASASDIDLAFKNPYESK